MARTISAEAVEVIGTGARYDTRVTITPPGGDAVEVTHGTGWSVTEAGADAGQRLGVTSLELLDSAGIPDLFTFAGYPGSIYRLDIGIAFGATTEWIRVFTGRVQEGSSRRNDAGVTVSLTDDWAWADKT